MLLKKYIGDRAFYRTLLAVAIPIMLQNSITNFVGLLDNVMVGQLGTEPMSGVSIVNQILFVFNLCIFGCVSGAGLFGAQFFGKQDHEGVRHTFRFKLISSLVIFGVAVLLLVTLDDFLINLYLHEGSETGDLTLALSEAKKYLSVCLIGLLPYTVTQIYSSSLREVGHTVPPMLASAVGVAVNFSLNYVLIFDKLGTSSFGVSGVVGAAVATVIARFAECGTVVVWAHLHRDRCAFIKGAYRTLRVPAALVKRIIVQGMPLLLNETLWAAGMATLLQCYSYRGIAVVSAINISNTILNTFSVMYLAIGSSISILIGQRLGKGETDEAVDAANKMMAFSVFTGLISTVLIALCAPFFPLLYNTSDEVRTLATGFALIIAVCVPLDAFVNASYFVLRSGGKTLLTFLFDSVYIWCVNVALAFVLSRYTSIHALNVFFICHAVNLFKCILGFILVKKGVWVQDITKTT